MNTLTKVYTAITGQIDYLTDSYLTNWLRQAHAEHDSLGYYIKKKIITENLFGVDIMEEGTEIAKLTTVALVEKKEEPSPPGSVNQRAISYVRWACKVVAACSKVAMVKSWVGPRRRL